MGQLTLDLHRLWCGAYQAVSCFVEYDPCTQAVYCQDAIGKVAVLARPAMDRSAVGYKI